MPIDYKNYASNWLTEIRPAILKRAKHKCETCHAVNYSVGHRDSGSGIFWTLEEIEDFVGEDEDDIEDFLWMSLGIDPKKKPIKIVLTIAHLDHNTRNNDPENLKALCQKCHLQYDAAHHAANRKANKARKNNPAPIVQVETPVAQVETPMPQTKKPETQITLF